MTNTTPSFNLYEETISLVAKCPRHISYRMMAEHIGVTPAWVSLFANRKIANAGIAKVQALHDYLTELC